MSLGGGVLWEEGMGGVGFAKVLMRSGCPATFGRTSHLGDWDSSNQSRVWPTII
jgi:hypothetical protein